MIVRPRPQAWQLLFIMRGSVVPRVAVRVLAIAALSCCVVFLLRRGSLHFGALTVAPLSLLGLALSIFLGFRNSACYERWWEARKQWGLLIIELRTFSRELVALLDDSVDSVPERGRALAGRSVRRGIAFAHALAAHLRGHDAMPWVERFLDTEESRRVGRSENVPDALLREGSAELAVLRRQGRLEDIPWQALNERLHALSGVQAACERIRLTPLPFAYTLLLHRTAYLFCLILPFGLADVLGWLTPVLAAIVAYTFFGLDVLGDELEDPFGEELNDLPLLAMARTVEINLLEALGEPVPEPLKPDDYVLL